MTPRRLRSSKGQGMVEFALVVLFFFAFLFPFADLARITFIWGSLNYAAHMTSRHARANDTQSALEVQNAYQAFANTMGMNLQLSDILVTSGAESVTVSVNKTITVNPLTGALLSIAGHRFEHPQEFIVQLQETVQTSGDLSKLYVP